MIKDAEIKKAIRLIEAKVKRAFELRDDGDRGAGRLVLVGRMATSRVVTEWYAVYYRAGKRVMSKMGSYPTMSLKDAREHFMRDYAPRIMAGEPVPLNATDLRKEARSLGTVEHLFQIYVEGLELAGKASAKNVRRILLSERSGMAKALGQSRAANSITPADIAEQLRIIHSRGSAIMARVTQSYLKSAFDCALKSEHDYTRSATATLWKMTVNPVAAVPVDPESVRTSDRFLSPAEFRAFWSWAEGRAEDSNLATAARLAMSIGQRVQEVLRIRVENYDRAEKSLFWPKTKNGKPHSVPLPDQAVEILESLIPDHGWFFPHRFDGDRCACYAGVNRVVQNYLRETGRAKFIARDMRRTWKTLAGRAGISKEARDRIQNHARGDISSKHYDRYDYLPEKRAAMAQWSAYLSRILAGEFDQEMPATISRLRKAA